MAQEFRHKRYFEYIGEDSSAVTFTSVDNAKTLISLNNTLFTTGNPVITYELVNNSKGLCVSFEFSTITDQTNFIAANSAAWADRPTMYATQARIYKHEWLNKDNNIGATTNF